MVKSLNSFLLNFSVAREFICTGFKRYRETLSEKKEEKKESIYMLPTFGNLVVK